MSCIDLGVLGQTEQSYDLLLEEALLLWARFLLLQRNLHRWKSASRGPYQQAMLGGCASETLPLGSCLVDLSQLTTLIAFRNAQIDC